MRIELVCAAALLVIVVSYLAYALARPERF